MADQTSIGRAKGRLMLASLVAQLALATVAWAGTPTNSVVPAAAGATATQSDTVAQLQKEIESLKSAVNTLKAHQDSAWMAKQRAAEVRAIVESTLKESKKESQYLDNPIQAGYDNGFFIRSADKDFQLNINGYLQFRYSYAAAGTASTPAGASSAHKNYSGFNFRRARLILSGNAFQNFIYCISGDFQTGISGASAGSNNAFAILDTWAGYKFSPMFVVRAGSMLVPFTHVEYFSSGTEFPDFAVVEAPFDPVRSDAVDLDGTLITHKLNYEIQVNNGSTSQDNGAVGPGGHFGNRMGVYGRVNFAGAGKISDFNDSPDVEDNQHFVWLLGAAAGYESQNSALQQTTSNPGLPTTAGNFASYTLNGGLVRATVDAHAKYRGFSFNSAVYYQHYDNTPVATFGYSSLGELGYYGEVGYFLVPHKWEIAGRAGELLFSHTGQHMYEGTLGLNYYIFGENAKIQTAVTYVNNAAYTNTNLGTTAGTNDWIGQVQFQFKF